MEKLIVPDRDESVLETPIVQLVAGKIPVVNDLKTYWVEKTRGRREKRVFNFLDDLTSEICRLSKELDSKLDRNYITSSEFVDCLVDATDLASREDDEVKRTYLKNYLINSGKETRPDTSLRKCFLSFLREFTGLHMRILSLIYEAQRNIPDNGLRVLALDLSRGEALSIGFVANSLGVTSELVGVLVTLLESRGLVIICESSENNDQRLVMQPITRKFMSFLLG